MTSQARVARIVGTSLAALWLVVSILAAFAMHPPGVGTVDAPKPAEVSGPA